MRPTRTTPPFTSCPSQHSRQLQPSTSNPPTLHTSHTHCSSELQSHPSTTFQTRPATNTEPNSTPFQSLHCPPHYTIAPSPSHQNHYLSPACSPCQTTSSSVPSQHTPNHTPASFPPTLINTTHLPTLHPIPAAIQPHSYSTTHHVPPTPPLPFNHPPSKATPPPAPPWKSGHQNEPTPAPQAAPLHPAPRPPFLCTHTSYTPLHSNITPANHESSKAIPHTSKARSENKKNIHITPAHMYEDEPPYLNDGAKLSVTQTKRDNAFIMPCVQLGAQNKHQQPNIRCISSKDSSFREVKTAPFIYVMMIKTGMLLSGEFRETIPPEPPPMHLDFYLELAYVTIPQAKQSSPHNFATEDMAKVTENTPPKLPPEERIPATLHNNIYKQHISSTKIFELYKNHPPDESPFPMINSRTSFLEEGVNDVGTLGIM